MKEVKKILFIFLSWNAKEFFWSLQTDNLFWSKTDFILKEPVFGFSDINYLSFFSKGSIFLQFMSFRPGMTFGFIMCKLYFASYECISQTIHFFHDGRFINLCFLLQNMQKQCILPVILSIIFVINRNLILRF